MTGNIANNFLNVGSDLSNNPVNGSGTGDTSQSELAQFQALIQQTTAELQENQKLSAQAKAETAIAQAQV